MGPRCKDTKKPVIDFFVLTSGAFGVLATFLLVYLALRSIRDARDLRLIQDELSILMRETKDLTEELHTLQREIHSDQQAAKHDLDETKRNVEQVTEVVEQVADVVVERRPHRPHWRHTAWLPIGRRR